MAILDRTGHTRPLVDRTKTRPLSRQATVGLTAPGTERDIPLTRAVSEFLSTGALRPRTIAALTQEGLAVTDLLLAGEMLRPQFAKLPPLGRAMAEAALDLLADASELGDLQASADLSGRTGFFMAGRLADAAFSAEHQGELRAVVQRMLTEGRVDPDAHALLSAGARAELTAGLDAHQDMLLGAAAPEKRDALSSLLGVLGVNVRGRADASARASVAPWAQSRLTLEGVDAEAGVGARAGVQASFDSGIDAFGGLAGADLSGSASADISAVAKATGQIGADSRGVRAQGYAGAKVEANAEAHLTQTNQLLGGQITDRTTVRVAGHAEASAEVRAVAHVGLDKENELEVEVGAEAHARAVAEARALARKDLNFFGFRIGVEGYVTAKAGAEASAFGMFTYKDGKVSVGAGYGAAAKVGLGMGGGVSVGLPEILARPIDGAARMVKSLFSKAA
jgi:hypothetical protein